MKVESRLQDRNKKMRVASKLSSFIFHLSTCLLLTSCSETLYVSVEQMIPPEMMPKHGASSVGVVSNFSENNVIIVNEDALVYPCNPDSIKEQIALSFAETDIMERVVILDSLLYPIDGTAPHFLTQEEVNDLCRELDVDMLYCLEYACMTTNPAAPTIGRPINAYLCSRIYTPDTDSLSGTATMDKKIIERWSADTADVRRLMPEIPYIMAEEAIEPYFPTWKERERVFYHDRLCYELREAKVYVGEGNWEAAAEHWRALSTSKFRTYRFMAAYNMALYYEMTDSIDKAIGQLDLAKEVATRSDKNGEAVTLIDTSLADEYRKALISRRKEIAIVKQYLDRMQ